MLKVFAIGANAPPTTLGPNAFTLDPDGETTTMPTSCSPIVDGVMEQPAEMIDSKVIDPQRNHRPQP